MGSGDERRLERVEFMDLPRHTLDGAEAAPALLDLVVTSGNRPRGLQSVASFRTVAWFVLP